MNKRQLYSTYCIEKKKILYWIKTKLDCIKSIKTIPMNKKDKLHWINKIDCIE